MRRRGIDDTVGIVERESDRRARAAEAADRMMLDRDAASALAGELLQEPADDAAASTAHRVLGHVALHRGNLDVARAHLDHAVEIGERCGDEQIIGEALLTRMGLLITIGDAERAVADSHVAEPLLSGGDRVKLLIQRGTALGLGLGRVDEAIETFDRVDADHPEKPPIVEAVLAMNRGTQLSIRGDHRRALDDFRTARHRYRELGNHEAECEVLLHEAQAAAEIGDFPTVFTLHAEVVDRHLFADHDARTHNDLAVALLRAGLRDEAEAASRRAVDVAVRSSADSLAAHEARLRLVRLSIDGSAPDHDGARTAAEAVREWADVHGHEALSARAGIIVARIDLSTGASERAVLRRFVQLAAALEASGHLADAHDLRIEAASMLLGSESEHRPSAASEVDVVLQPVLESDERNRTLDPVAGARRCHAEALLRLAAGDRRGALRQIDAGLDRLERVRGRIASLEIRSSASDRAPALAELGLRVAMSSRRSRNVLRWAERQRAAALRLAVSTTPGKTPMSHSEGGSDRRAIRRVRAEDDVVVVSHPDDVVEAVGTRRLVEFVELDGWIHRLVVTRGRVRHRRVASAAEVADQLDALLFGLRGASTRQGAAGQRAAAVAAGAADRLDGLLFAGLPCAGDDDRLVVVPTGRLHALAWNALVTCRASPTSVAPSAHLWIATERRPERQDTLVAMSGPDVPLGRPECETVARLANGRVIAGPDGPTDRRGALEAFAVADVVHLAAHGTFRHDNPLLSALHLADGELFAHEFELLDDMPSTVVLTACHVGAVGLRAGDEPLGFPAVLSARGTRCLVAPIMPVEDEASRDLAVEFHRRLHGGHPASAALALAASDVRDRSSRHAAAAATFQCFGAG